MLIYYFGVYGFCSFVIDYRRGTHSIVFKFNKRYSHTLACILEFVFSESPSSVNLCYLCLQHVDNCVKYYNGCLNIGGWGGVLKQWRNCVKKTIGQGCGAGVERNILSAKIVTTRGGVLLFYV